MKRTIAILTAALLSAGTGGTAFAYVGPGAGLSLLGALWGLLLAVGAALFFVIFWPVRRMIRNSRKKKAEEDDGGMLDDNTESPKR